MKSILKRIFSVFTFVFVFSFCFFGIRAYAYSETSVTPEQLQTALTAFKNRVDSYEPWQNVLEGTQKYYTIYFDSTQYVIYLDTVRPVVIPSGTSPGNPFGYDPVLKVFPQSTGRFDTYMVINSNGTYTLPTSLTTGDSGPHEFWKNPDRSVYYTSYDIYNYPGNVWVRSAIPLGTKYCPTDAQIGGPIYVYDASVPTPVNLRTKMILPEGLFPKIRETQLQTTWNPNSGALRMEVSLMYNYKVGTDKVTKLLPFITYSDGLYSSVGTFTKLLQTDIEAFIHSKNTATVGQTFENGKLNLTHCYYRYAVPGDSGLKYGNWVRVDLVTKGTDIIRGNVVSQYDEVKTDSNGDEIEVTDSEYGGIQIDNSGNVVDPKSLTSLQDYLLAIPNLLGSFFSSVNSLISSAGQFGVFFSTAFGFLPPVVSVIIVASIFAVIVVGIIKLFK